MAWSMLWWRLPCRPDFHGPHPRAGPCLPPSVLENRDGLSSTISRLRELTQDGDYAYYVDIAFFIADLPLPAARTAPQWLDVEQATRERWRELVTARRDFLRTRQ
jgi:hypothetical protein